jgi:hypothetical protein
MVCAIWNNPNYYGHCLTQATESIWDFALTDNLWHYQNMGEQGRIEKAWDRDTSYKFTRHADGTSTYVIKQHDNLWKWLEIGLRRGAGVLFAVSVTPFTALLGFAIKIIHLLGLTIARN